MSQFISIDLENLDPVTTQSYAILTFPQKVKILNASFTVNYETYGTQEQARIWRLFAMASHPYEDGGSDNEWIWPIFGESAKPLVTRADNLRFTSNISNTGVYTGFDPGPPFTREVHEGVLNPGDYLVLAVELESGDISTITWENTRAHVTIEYEETARKSAYQERDWWNWDM